MTSEHPRTYPILCLSVDYKDYEVWLNPDGTWDKVWVKFLGFNRTYMYKQLKPSGRAWMRVVEHYRAKQGVRP
jgi:hypothetical protein